LCYEIGKTSVALALAKLFGWGHTQSDNVKAKKAAPAFLSNVQKLLQKHDVVIADKYVPYFLLSIHSFIPSSLFQEQPPETTPYPTSRPCIQF